MGFQMQRFIKKNIAWYHFSFLLLASCIRDSMGHGIFWNTWNCQSGYGDNQHSHLMENDEFLMEPTERDIECQLPMQETQV